MIGKCINPVSIVAVIQSTAIFHRLPIPSSSPLQKKGGRGGGGEQGFKEEIRHEKSVDSRQRGGRRGLLERRGLYRIHGVDSLGRKGTRGGRSGAPRIEEGNGSEDERGEGEIAEKHERRRSDTGPVINEESNFQVGDLTSAPRSRCATRCGNVKEGRGTRGG